MGLNAPKCLPVKSFAQVVLDGALVTATTALTPKQTTLRLLGTLGVYSARSSPGQHFGGPEISGSLAVWVLRTPFTTWVPLGAATVHAHPHMSRG